MVIFTTTWGRLRPQFNSWVSKIPSRRDRLPTPVFLGFPGGSAGKESTCNAGDLGLIPGLGRFPGEGNSYPLQYSGLEQSMDCIVHGVTKSWTWLSNFHCRRGKAIQRKQSQERVHSTFLLISFGWLNPVIPVRSIPDFLKSENQ